MQLRQSGFTIIELIVVIAIIAVLATIVGTSTVVYVNKAKDATVKADISQTAKAMLIYFSQTGTYEDFPTPTLQLPNGAPLNIYTSSSAFVIFARLASSQDYWAQDSTGKTAKLATEPSGTTADEGNGQYYCDPACSDGYICQQGDGGSNSCQLNDGGGGGGGGGGTCGGTCGGCDGLGSNDYLADGSDASYSCQYFGQSCCSSNTDCYWNNSSNDCEGNPCTGSGGSCGTNCGPGSNNCTWSQ